MADSFGTPETDITALTEALKSQQHLLQKLYADLDQEREASSTAADEALSMILRLQGEKSAVKMRPINTRDWLRKRSVMLRKLLRFSRILFIRRKWKLLLWSFSFRLIGTNS